MTNVESKPNFWTPLQHLQKCEQWLDNKLGLETQGIDRIAEDEKRAPPMINSFLIWWSITCHVGQIPLGVLGPEFGLSLKQSIGCIVAGTFLGSLCPAYTATLGPKTGLRQIAVSRYAFGYWGAKLCSILNIVVNGGFAVVNVVVAGQILSAVSDYTMSIAVGCIIVAVCSYLISVFGFRIIHRYEKYSWILAVVLTSVLFGQVAPHVDATVSATDSGLALAGSLLTFLFINFSSASGWCSIAADYSCNYPQTTSLWLLFISMLLGIFIPTTFIVIVGACIGNAALSASGSGYPPFSKAYNDHYLGGLLREVYHPLGFSKFCLVLAAFTVLGTNVAVNYSSGLSLQTLGRIFHGIPRFILSFAFALVVACLAIVGKEHLSTIVDNFVSLLGYWTISFTLILLVEDQWFRRHSGYVLEVWNTPRRLPLGIAAVTSLLASYVGGGVPGMAQVWYVGPVARQFGPDGGDCGVLMSGVITLLTYPLLRWLEHKYGPNIKWKPEMEELAAGDPVCTADPSIKRDMGELAQEVL